MSWPERSQRSQKHKNMMQLHGEQTTAMLKKLCHPIVCALDCMLKREKPGILKNLTIGLFNKQINPIAFSYGYHRWSVSDVSFRTTKTATLTEKLAQEKALF